MKIQASVIMCMTCKKIIGLKMIQTEIEQEHVGTEIRLELDFQTNKLPGTYGIFDECLNRNKIGFDLSKGID